MRRYLTYTNRRGQKVYLRKRPTRSGQIRYVFTKEDPAEDCLTKVPTGYEITENIHGRVALRKIGPRPISDIELRIVDRVLHAYPHLRRCRAAAKGKTIEVFEPKSDSLEAIDRAKLYGWSQQRLRDYERAHIEYWAQMRFVLIDKKLRHFRVDRMCYRSWVDGWMSLAKEGPLEELAAHFLPHLTRPSFFELWPF